MALINEREIIFDEPAGDPGTGYQPTPTPTPAPAPSPPPPPPAPTARVPSALAAIVQPLSGLVVPLDATPSQVLAVSLAGQSCQIDVYQKSTGLYLDLRVADRAIVLGVLCRDRNVLVVDRYRGFAGDLAFYDTQGGSDPYYDGLGTRWQLVYLT